MKLSVTEVPLAEIHLPKRSLKEHPERQIQQIADSIQAFGFNDPIAIDENGEIIEGVGRLLALKKLGFTTVPAIRLEHLSDAQKKAYRVAHNKITLNTGFDLTVLREEFDALLKLDDQQLLDLTGFEPIELDDLLKTPEIPELEADLIDTLKDDKVVICPHCGGEVHV